MLDANVQSFFVLLQVDQKGDCSVILTSFNQLIDSCVNWGFVPSVYNIFLFLGFNFRSFHWDKFSKTMFFSQSVGFLDDSSLFVKSDSLFNKSLSLKIVCRPCSYFLWSGHTETHDFTIKSVGDSDFDSLRVILSLSIEMNGFTEHSIFFHVSCK